MVSKSSLPKISQIVDLLAFWALAIFMLARILDSRPESRACERE